MIPACPAFASRCPMWLLAEVCMIGALRSCPISHADAVDVRCGLPALCQNELDPNRIA